MRRRKGFLLAVLLLACLFVWGCQQEQKPEAVAMVNGDPITRAELDQHYLIVKTFYEQSVLGGAPADGSGPAPSLDEEKDREVIKKLQEQSYEEMILQKLLWQEAATRKIEVSDQEAKAGLDQQAYETFLKKNGIDEAFFHKELKTQILYSKLREAVTTEVSVDEKEAREYYKAHTDEFKDAGGIEVFHILVSSPEQADELTAQLQQGADFGELARTYSDCPSKKEGGALGLINPDSPYDQTFKDAALALQPGTMTAEPVKTRFGYHIIKVGQRQEAVQKTFDQVRLQIMNQLKTDQQEEMFGKYLNELRDKAVIKDLRKA